MMKNHVTYFSEPIPYEMQSDHNEGWPGKSTPNVSLLESADVDDSGYPREVEWRTGVWARFPWTGCGGILMMLLGILAMGLVLGTSNGQARESWPSEIPWKKVNGKWERQSQLSTNVASTIVDQATSLALGVAFGEGIAIAWWRRASRGSTVQDLHYSWGLSESLRQLLTAGRKFNWIALAALVAKFSFFNGIILQEAFKTAPGVYTQKNVTVSLPMVTELPPNYAGAYAPDGHSGGTSYAFSLDITDFLNGTVLDPGLIYTPREELHTGYDTGCIGVCNATFQGFGIDWICEPDYVSSPFELTPETTLNDSTTTVFDSQTNQNVTLYKNTLLRVEAFFVPANGYINSNYSAFFGLENQTYNYSIIGMYTEWSNIVANESDDTTCTGTTSRSFCALSPVVKNYPVTITNATENKKDDGKSNVSGLQNGIRLIEESEEGGFDNLGNINFKPIGVNRTAAQLYNSSYDSNLRAIADFLDNNFGSRVTMEYINDTVQTEYDPSHGKYVAMLHEQTIFGNWYLDFDPSSSCFIEVTDPYYTMAPLLDRLMFISSMRASTNYSIRAATDAIRNGTVQSFETTMNINTVVYSTDWRYGGVAMSFVFLCMLCVLPNYWGFWELGRKVSFNPIEIASAFRSPTLETPGAATADVGLLVKEIGNRPLKYGEVAGQHKLGIADPAEIRDLRTTKLSR